MELAIKPKLLRAMPAQIIPAGGGVILKRGVLEVHVGGERALEVVEVVYKACAGEGTTQEELVEMFAPRDQPAIEELIEKLRERKLIVNADDASGDAPDDELGIFYWNLGHSAADVTRRLSARRVAILGVNHISRQMMATFEASGFHGVTVVDYPLLRNVHLFGEGTEIRPERWPHLPPVPFDAWSEDLSSETVECIVATSDFGGAHWMRQWNEVAVANKLHFLPVVLQNLIGYVGPLVVPGETACYECLRARQNSHLQDVDVVRAPEEIAFEGQGYVGFHPAMASILGEIAAMELTKLYCGAIPTRRVGTLIEVNMLLPTITPRRVLKVPRCPVCGPLVTRPPATTSRSTFLPGN